MKKILLATVCAVALSACASNSGDIKAAYVSPIQFEKHSCSQLAGELDRVGARLMEASRAQDQEAAEDVLVTAAGAIVFLPILFFIDGDGAGAAEVSRLKGEFDAIEQTAIKNDQLEYQKQRSGQTTADAS